MGTKICKIAEKNEKKKRVEGAIGGEPGGTRVFSYGRFILRSVEREGDKRLRHARGTGVRGSIGKGHGDVKNDSCIKSPNN